MLVREEVRLIGCRENELRGRNQKALGFKLKLGDNVVDAHASLSSHYGNALQSIHRGRCIKITTDQEVRPRT